MVVCDNEVNYVLAWGDMSSLQKGLARSLGWTASRCLLWVNGGMAVPVGTGIQLILCYLSSIAGPNKEMRVYCRCMWSL